MVDIKPVVIKPRQPRPAREGKYSKVNAYTLSPSKQQFLTILLFICIVSLHEIFVTPQVPKINQSILWTIFGFRYGLVILIGWDYYILTEEDPVDRIIETPQIRYEYNYHELRNCSVCSSTVRLVSHHCMTCNRCTQDFDHHCKFLNNCIGVRNYEYFMRILIVFSVFILLGIGIAVWVLVENQNVIHLELFRKWIIVGYICLSGVTGCVVTSLLGFHLYISLCINMTTLQYISPYKSSQKPQLKTVSYEQSPSSAQYFVKTLQDHGAKINNVHGVRVTSKDFQKNQQMEFYRK